MGFEEEKTTKNVVFRQSGGRLPQAPHFFVTTDYAAKNFPPFFFRISFFFITNPKLYVIINHYIVERQYKKSLPSGLILFCGFHKYRKRF